MTDDNCWRLAGFLLNHMKAETLDWCLSTRGKTKKIERQRKETKNHDSLVGNKNTKV